LVTRLLASKRAGVGTIGILECNFLSENAHRAQLWHHHMMLQIYFKVIISLVNSAVYCGHT
jgi:hypothetical protein